MRMRAPFLAKGRLLETPCGLFACVDTLCRIGSSCVALRRSCQDSMHRDARVKEMLSRTNAWHILCSCAGLLSRLSRSTDPRLSYPVGACTCRQIGAARASPAPLRAAQNRQLLLDTLSSFWTSLSFLHAFRSSWSDATGIGCALACTSIQRLVLTCFGDAVGKQVVWPCSLQVHSRPPVAGGRLLRCCRWLCERSARAYCWFRRNGRDF